MTINEKILFEKNRHIKKVEELKASLEMEYSLYEKNMDELKNEEVKERLARFGIAPETEKVDLSLVKPFSFDDSLKIPEEKTEKINQQLDEMVQRNEEMKKNGIDVNTGFAESFGAQSPVKSQLEMLAEDNQIIAPDYNQEEINTLFDSESKGKSR